MSTSQNPSLCYDSSYGAFRYTVGSRRKITAKGTRKIDFVELTFRKDSARKFSMYDDPKKHINFYGKSSLTDDWRCNKKRGLVSIKPFERQLLDTAYCKGDIKGLVNAVNDSLTLMRNDSRYKTR
ncbi:MAG: hypothetical protein V1678_03890 [Candidatus Aenigmatarchaeota archaeon]